MNDLKDSKIKYPDLFAPIDQPGRHSQFELLAEMPSDELIGNAYIVPKIGPNWLYILDETGRIQIPGGKKEPGETVSQILAREVREESGAEIINYSLIGGWYTFIKNSKPKFPHLPFPYMYMIVVTGEVKIVTDPIEKVSVIEKPLMEVVSELRSQGRKDLADLYQFSSAINV